MSDFLYIDQKTRTNVEKTSQANISKDLFENYRIDRSLRFNSADSAYLSRTPSVAGNRKTWTFSAWAKRTTVGSAQANYILGNAQAPSGTNGVYFGFGSDTLFFGDYGASGWDWYVQSSSLYRDTSAWYHVVAQYDTTQATASERVKLYVNGVRLTAFDGASTYPTLNVDGRFNRASFEMAIGRLGTYNGNYFNGYITEVNFIDGQALTPSSFGFFDNQRDFTWKPKKYSGSYGNNGFYLNFSNNSSASLLGKDFSGNGNNWTPNNFSVTAGAGNDSLVDSPTNYGSDSGVGGEVRGNYCTLNPLAVPYSGTISNGNLEFSKTNTGFHSARGSIYVKTGKWYCEVKLAATSDVIGVAIGIMSPSSTGYVGFSANSYAYRGSGSKYNNDTSTSYGASYSVGDVIGVALDMDAGTLTFYKNGVSQGLAFSSLSGEFTIGAGWYGTFGTAYFEANFGQRPFAYTAPTGFKALCTTNLPIPSIKKPSLYFDAVTYTGNGATQSITGLGFSPKLLWTKGRNLAQNHNLFDTLRIGKRLRSDTTGAEALTTVMLDSNGFTLGTETESNNSGSTFVAWCWNKSPIAGMDIVSFVSPSGTTQSTVAHNLGVAPKMIITKNRDTDANNWAVFHSSVCDTTSKFLQLNTTAGITTFSTVWGASLPTSSVFGITGGGVAASGVNCIAYLFAEIEGFSKFGSYTGNGSTDGPFVFCGFRPRWILFKASSVGGAGYNWGIYDTARDTFNVFSNGLFPNLADAETGGAFGDMLSNGFKLRNSSAAWNSSGQTYIFAAFAEVPFRYANAR